MPIGEPVVLALGEKFVGETLRVAIYGNATPLVKDLGVRKWTGIGVAEGLAEVALGISVPGGLAGSVAESIVEVPVVEKLRRKRAKQQVGVAGLRGVVGLYCSSSDFYVADLRWGKERPRRTPPKLSRIALRVPLADISASIHQSGGLDRLRIEVASLQSPLIFTTRPGTNHFSQVAAWMTANG